MRRQRVVLLLSAGALVTWGIANAIAGCGGDDGATVNNTPPDGSTGDENASSTSSSGGSSTSSSGGTGGDGGSSSGGDGGSTTSSGNLPAPNPGKITCGTTECDAGNFNGGSCCVREAGASLTCIPAFGPGSNCNQGGIEISCDEPADCTIGDQVRACCLVIDNNGGGGNPDVEGQRCSQNPNGGCGGGGGQGGGIRICKSNADCPGDAGTCSQKTCAGFKAFVCGSPQACQ